MIGVALFFWAGNQQQFDDLGSPAVLPLLEDLATDAAPSDPAVPLPDVSTAGADPDQD
jgi:nitrogen fixation-related uncharacterized protein